MAPEIAAGRVIICACSGELSGSFSLISGNCPTLRRRGLETPAGVTTRTSRAPSGASAAAVMLATSFFSSRGGGDSAREMPPRFDSIVTADCGGTGGGTFVADNPGSPSKTKRVTDPRFSPAKVADTVVPRWIHSMESELSLGTGWAIKETTVPNVAASPMGNALITQTARDSLPLSEQRRDRFGLHEFARLVEVVEDDGVRIDPERVVHRRQNLDRVHRVFGRRRGGRVGFAVEGAPPDARAGDQRRVAIRPVIAAIGRVAVAGSADAQARRASEFTNGDDQSLLQHAALLHIFEQGGEAAVEFRAVQVAQRSEVRGVGVPGIHGRIAVGHRRPVDLHEARPGFDEPAGKEQALAKSVAAVAVAQLVGFLGQEPDKLRDRYEIGRAHV